MSDDKPKDDKQKSVSKPPADKGWEGKELRDIEKNWKPRYGTKEYKRKMSRKYV